MARPSNSQWRVISLVVTTLAVASPAVAAEDENWHFSLTPYVWLPSIEGAGNFESPPDGGGRPNVEVGPIDYFEHLELALMLAGEVRRGNWSVRSDLVYVDFGDQRALVRTVTGPGGAVEIPIDAGTTISLNGLEWQVALGYQAMQTQTITLEVLGGFRYLDVAFSLDWRFDGALNLLPESGSFTQDVKLWDAIIGVRGRALFGNGKWFAPYHFDLGAGSSDLTWQVLAGLGYGFSWGDVLAAYRHLEYDEKKGDLLQGIRFSGPAIGVTFRF